MTADLSCAGEGRRIAVRKATLFGVDYVEVSAPKTLEVFFLGRAPQQVRVGNVQISGGRRIAGIRVTAIRMHRQKDQTLDDWMEVTVDRTGDFSDYALSLVKLDDQERSTDEPMDGFDPLYNAATFNFRADCPTGLDCKQTPSCPPPKRAQPDINYLAKDYDSFRQLILDRLALTMPKWQETHVPDIGIMLVELLAYTGDYLSYYQDAVATEAYLRTARQRISVRRHARLVDYRMHEGCNARAWVTIATDSEVFPLQPKKVFFTTALPGKLEQRVFQAGDLRLIPADTYEVFELLVEDTTKVIKIYKVHSEIHFYTWGDTQCCLVVGARSATLTDAWLVPSAPGAAEGTPKRALQLAVGDVLIFEEVIGPGTGNPADADPTHRQAVRLTKVTAAVDSLLGQPVLEIEWGYEDALTFALCISTRLPAPSCEIVTNVSVVRGNVVLVDHGADITEVLGTVPAGSTVEHCGCECDPPYVETVPAKFCPVLGGMPVTFVEPLPPCGSAAALLVQDPRQALPEVSVTGTVETVRGEVQTTWTPVLDLLESESEDAGFVVEIDNAGAAHLRFGDGDLGQMPEAGTAFAASYRVGNGTAGNVGAEKITCIVFRDNTENVGMLVPRNPMPAVGGVEQEPIEEVKLFAPGAFRDVLERAITADDYAALAADNARRLSERVALEQMAMADASVPTVKADRASQEEETEEGEALGVEICSATFENLQAAKARIRWTGSWSEVLVATDPAGTEDADAELLEEIAAYLRPYRRIGHDLRVGGAEYVGLDVALRVCVQPEYLRGHVEAALLDALSNRVLVDGSLGFFYPDNLTFGGGVYASQLVAVAQNIAGVRSVRLIRLKRLAFGEPPADDSASEEVPAGGALKLGAFEIARVDNDPNYPEHGRLTLLLEGGR